MRRWLQLCEQNHKHYCNVQIMAPVNGLYVIDVHESRLVKAAQNCRYVALSYVWGTSPTVKTVRANFARHQEHGAMKNPAIPTTIQDAMTIVEGMGERRAVHRPGRFCIPAKPD
jgi:hypothetical protein